MLCEMCGEDVASTSRVRIEGSVLRVCPSCAKYGLALDPPPSTVGAVPSGRGVRPGAGPVTPLPRASPRGRNLEERDLFRELPELELAPDWSRRIRTAREKLNWTPEELGKRLNEKKSVVLKMESGSFRPPDEMVRKIERLLKIRLRAESEAAAT